MSARRGQTLLLFAMGVLLLTLAVMLCLALAQSTRRKMQLQVAADTAAYAQAVATARTFNSIALMNRAQAATMIALTGVQSAASFAGLWIGGVVGAHDAFRTEWTEEYCHPTYPTVRGPNATRCELARYTYYPGENSSGVSGPPGPDPVCKTPALDRDARSGFVSRTSRVISLIDEPRFRALDERTGVQALAIHVEAMQWSLREHAAMATLRSELPNLAAQALQPVGAFAGQVTTTAAELDRAVGPGQVRTGVEIAMGSRAHPFITRREDATRVLEQSLRAVFGVGADELRIVGFQGSGYFATQENHGSGVSEQAAWGDDHGRIEVNYRGPGNRGDNDWTGSAELRGWASTTDEQDRSDSHSWCPFALAETPAPDRHPLLPHPMVPFDVCPMSSCIWPDFVDVNTASLSNVGDAFGQPKLQLSASMPPDTVRPWNLLLSWEGTELSSRNDKSVGGVTPTLQTVASAMAYYHRPSHWREPPNLWNPYWRAVLVRADVDDPQLNDARAALTGAGADWAAENTRALLGVGFRGIP